MKTKFKKQFFTTALALSLLLGLTQPAANSTFAATQSADKLYSANADKIDIYKINRKPNAKNYKAEWNERIFYTLEDINTKSSKDGQIKKYKLVRKELINKKNGNRIEYEVYKHPKTGKMHKIVSIEHRKNDLEITDYYYDDKGMPNFIYQRKDSIYTPTYASFERTGNRYFFNNDSLIKWRWVKKANKVEELSLKVDTNRKDVKQYDYKGISKSKQNSYDKKEVKMLNAAYNTYNAMLKKSKKSVAKGYILDSKRNPVANATVEFLYSGKVIGTVKTNAKGYYTTGLLPVKEGYTLRVSADGYITTEGAKAVIDKTGVIIWIANITLVAISEASHKVSINVYDGENIKYSKKNIVKTPLSGAEVIARKGLNNKTGEQVTIGNTDAGGNLVIEPVNGVYTLEIRMNGYVVGYKTIVVDDDKNVTVAMTRPVTDNQMKVVLSWDGANDLDSYLFTPYKAKKGNMAYIGGNVKKDKHGNSLYLDSKDGNGVEIINIANIKKGYYKYYVSDYTNSLKKNYSAKDMEGLNIRVEVYDKNGLTAVYIIPYNPNGVIWEVFEIKNGKVVPLQNTYKNVKEKKWWVEKKKKYKTGEVVIPFKYDNALNFSEGLAAVELNGKWGFINKSGKVVIPFKYDYAWSFSEGLSAVALNGKWGFINKSGKEVTPIKYDYVENFSKGLAEVELNNKRGFVNKLGKEVIPIKYDAVWAFSEGLAEVGLSGKWGFVNKLGKEVIPLKYDYVRAFSEGLAEVELNGKCGYINKSGREVIPLKYDDAAEYFNEGLAQVGLNGKWGYINKSGREVIPLKYDSADDFCKGLAGVGLNGKWGCINKSGREVIPLKYDGLDRFRVFREGLAKVELNGKWGYINKSDREMIPLKYDFTYGFIKGLARVELNGKHGYINKSGREVISVKYDTVSYSEEGLVKVVLNGKWGYINKSGKVVIPLKYGYASDFSEGLAMVGLNDKRGYVNKSGKVVIRLKYDAAGDFREGLAPVELNGKWGFISR